MRQIAEATWQCGDPGMQFDTTVNRWHTCKTTARINASNPCSEYMFLDDSACNLCVAESDEVRRAGRAVRRRGLPPRRGHGDHWRRKSSSTTPAIRPRGSRRTRTITVRSGSGFANLGALLMSMGVPYDSDQGRDFAGAITAVMCGQAYLTSARIAEATGPFPGYLRERAVVPRCDPHASRCGQQHRQPSRAAGAVRGRARSAGIDAYEKGKVSGYRNAQTTVIAPTGTIGFMMDCDTTGIEPDLALVKYKKLVGGGVIKIVNKTVPQALIKLGYTPEQVEQIVAHIDATGTIEGAPHLKDEHLAVFDCSFRPQNGARFIHHMGHVQDDGRGAAVHLRRDLEDDQHAGGEHGRRHHERLHRELAAGPEGGRDLSRQLEARAAAQLGIGQGREEGGSRQPLVIETVVEKIVYRPVRRKLPDERQSITHKFSIGGHEGYITVGLYEDGTPGEVFITMAKEGSTISGLMDSFATAVSYALQYGVPLKFFVDKFSHVRFEPSGWTGNQQVPYAKSIMDYIFRWLGAKFLGPEYAVGEAGDTPTSEADRARVRSRRCRSSRPSRMRRCAPNADRS